MGRTGRSESRGASPDPGPDNVVGPPSGAQFPGFWEAHKALGDKKDCAEQIAGKDGLSVSALPALLWNANVSVGTTMQGNTPVQVEILPDGGYNYTYQTARTSGGNIELNGSYFPNPEQQNVFLPTGVLSFVQLVNETLKTNMNVTQFYMFVFLHEMSHVSNNKSSDIDTNEFNRNIIEKCIN